MIDPFRTPFWTEEKRWLVICTWYPKDRFIEIYTPLVSTHDLRPGWYPDTLTVTNFARENEYYTKYENVFRFQLVPCLPNNFGTTVVTDDGRDDKFLFCYEWTDR